PSDGQVFPSRSARLTTWRFTILINLRSLAPLSMALMCPPSFFVGKKPHLRGPSTVGIRAWPWKGSRRWGRGVRGDGRRRPAASRPLGLLYHTVFTCFFGFRRCFRTLDRGGSRSSTDSTLLARIRLRFIRLSRLANSAFVMRGPPPSWRRIDALPSPGSAVGQPPLVSSAPPTRAG